MTYEIECFIETIDSEGCFTIRGAEGYCLEKDGKTYNVLWPNGDQTNDKSNSTIECLWVEREFTMRKGNSQREFLLLISAKTNHSKVKLFFVKDSEKNLFTLKKIDLI